MSISGSGGRMHAVEEAASIHHLADELGNDLKRQGGHLAEEVHSEVLDRIHRLRQQAYKIERMILAYDTRNGLVE